jgi:hypothetical protein
VCRFSFQLRTPREARTVTAQQLHESYIAT